MAEGEIGLEPEFAAFAAVSKPNKDLSQIRESLRNSAEMRMRAIQQRISTTEVFFTTVETEIRFGELDRARDHLNKLRSLVEKLIAHIDNPAHVTDKLLKEQFRKQLLQIKLRLSTLHSKVNHLDGTIS
jgi:hypothetical protein